MDRYCSRRHHDFEDETALKITAVLAVLFIPVWIAVLFLIVCLTITGYTMSKVIRWLR